MNTSHEQIPIMQQHHAFFTSAYQFSHGTFIIKYKAIKSLKTSLLIDLSIDFFYGFCWLFSVVLPFSCISIQLSPFL